MFGVQVNDDGVILDKTLADQVSTWKSSRGLAETVVLNHACSGENCTYYQIGDVFVCEKTGNVHGKSNLSLGQNPDHNFVEQYYFVSIFDEYNVESDFSLFFCSM